MRAIAEPFFERSPYLLGPVFTLLLFFVVFLGVIAYVMRARRPRFDELSALPFREGVPSDSEGESLAAGGEGADESVAMMRS